MPALNDAISQRRFKQVYFLMNHGVDLNQRNLAGKTPLMQLCELQPEGTALVLAKGFVKRGARIELSDLKGRNSLVYAILHRREKLTSYFLEEAINYDLNAKDCDGNTPLSHAAARGNLEIVRSIVQLLKKFRLSVDVPNKEGETPLMRASKHGHIFCAKFILSEGKASIYMRDNKCWKTALEWEESLGFENQPNLEFESLFSERQMEDARRNSAPTGSKESTIETRPDTSPSLYKPRTSQRQEIVRLFDVYKDQFSSNYRKGYANRKRDETLNNENEPFDSSLDKELKDQFEEDLLEISTSSGSSTRRLFAKGAAVVKFKKGSGLRGTRTSSSLAVSFTPGQAIRFDNISLIEKSSQTKPESPKTALNRPQRPRRSKSEMPFDSICRLSKETENKFNSKSNKLPRIILKERRRTESSMSTVLEDEENEN